MSIVLRFSTLSLPSEFIQPDKGAYMLPFTSEQIQQNLEALKGWQVEKGQLTKMFRFDSFVTALNFVNRVGELAERAGHHPDIDIRYNQVQLGLSTHDAGGITAKDFDLAGQADQLGMNR